MIKPGLVSISFRQLPWEAVLNLTQKAGLEGIEWGGDKHVPCGNLSAAKQVGLQTRLTGIDVACYGSYCRLKDEEYASGSLQAVVDTAHALGAPLIRVWAGEKASASAGKQDWQEVIRNSKRLLALAWQHNIEVAFEYHADTLTDTAESATRLLGNFNDEKIGCLWQPPVDMEKSNCLNGLMMLGNALRNVHVFAWKGQERLALATHSERWMQYLKAMHHIAGNRYALLEFVKDDSPEQLLQDAATLKSLLANVFQTMP